MAFNDEVVRQSLIDQIFTYISASPQFCAESHTIHQRYTQMGYHPDHINYALTELINSGTITLRDDGALVIGS